MDCYLLISHTCLSCLPSRWVSPGPLYYIRIALIVVLLAFLCMVSIALFLWEAGTLLGVGYWIMLHCFRKGKYQQSFTTCILSLVYNVLCWPRRMHWSVLMVSMSEVHLSGPTLFPRWAEYEFAYQFWYCEHSIKNQWRER